jgi:hypothetical protein
MCFDSSVKSLAKNRNLSPEGYEGGLLIDEMTIQQDIQFSKKGGNLEINWI